MIAYFDVEFIDGDGGREFFSIGVLRSDGQTLHRISADADLDRAGWWFRKNVLRQVRNEPRQPLANIRLDLHAMLEGVTVLVTRDGGHDEGVLRQVVAEPPPIFDIQTVWQQMGEPKLPNRANGHHALVDAEWHKTLLEALLGQHVLDVWYQPPAEPVVKKGKVSKQKVRRFKRARALMEESYTSIAL